MTRRLVINFPAASDPGSASADESSVEAAAAAAATSTGCCMLRTEHVMQAKDLLTMSVCICLLYVAHACVIKNQFVSEA